MLTEAEKLKHIKHIIEYNPREKVFPVNTKRGGGIALAIWVKACEELDLNFGVRSYEHRIVSAEHCSTEIRLEIFLQEEKTND